MKLLSLAILLTALAGCCTTEPTPEPQPTEIKKHDQVLKPVTPEEQNAWPRRGWDTNQANPNP